MKLYIYDIYLHIYVYISICLSYSQQETVLTIFDPVSPQLKKNHI